MSFTAIVENDTIKLPPDIHLPDGTRVSIATPTEPPPPPTGAADEGLLRLAENPVDDPATDAAIRHDDYLY